MDVIKGKCGTDCNTCQFKEKLNCGVCPELPCKSLMNFIENGHNTNRLPNLNKWKNEDL